MKPTLIGGTFFDELLFCQIKNLMKPVMKPALTGNKPAAMADPRPLRRTPFADLMLHRKNPRRR